MDWDKIFQGTKNLFGLVLRYYTDKKADNYLKLAQVLIEEYDEDISNAEYHVDKTKVITIKKRRKALFKTLPQISIFEFMKPKYVRYTLLILEGIIGFLAFYNAFNHPSVLNNFFLYSFIFYYFGFNFLLSRYYTLRAIETGRKFYDYNNYYVAPTKEEKYMTQPQQTEVQYTEVEDVITHSIPAVQNNLKDLQHYIEAVDYVDKLINKDKNGAVNINIELSKTDNEYIDDIYVNFPREINASRFDKEDVKQAFIYGSENLSLINIIYDDNCVKNKYIRLIFQKKSLPEILMFDESMLDFEKEDTRNTKFFIGLGYDGPVYFDVFDLPHMLLAGATNSGKSNLSLFLIMQMARKGELHIFDFSTKNATDFYIFRKKGYDIVTRNDGLDRIAAKMDMLTNEIKRRNKIIQEAECVNIYGYNKKFPENKMDMVYIVIDEYLSLVDMIDDNEGYDDNNIELASQTARRVSEILRTARSCGMILMVIVQDPRIDKDYFTSKMRNQFNVRIAARLQDSYASEIMFLDGDIVNKAFSNAIDSKGFALIQGAVNVSKRINFNDKFIFLKVPLLEFSNEEDTVRFFNLIPSPKTKKRSITELIQKNENSEPIVKPTDKEEVNWDLDFL